MSTDLSHDAPTRSAPDDASPGPGHRGGPAAGSKGPSATDTVAGPRVAAWRGLLTPSSILTILGVLVPLAVMVRLAVIASPTFDGGMNLQVAQNIAAGKGYVSDYNGIEAFPDLIQTSGPYIFLAAAFIKLFGNHTFVYQLPNVLAIALLLVAVAVGLRRWPVLRVVGPSVVLFAVPGLVSNAMNGYGEYVVAALVMMAIVLIDLAITGRRPLLLAAGAFALLGVAVTIKVIALLAVPVVLVGWVLVVLARRDLKWGRAFLPLAPFLLVLALFELYRLVVLGMSRYVTYWTDQIVNIGAQAGVNGAVIYSSGAPETVGTLTKIQDHLHLLSESTKGLWNTGAVIPTSLICLVLVVPFLLLLTLFLTRRTGWRQWLQRPGAVLAAQLAVYSGGYLVWWLAITPTEKAWLRRIAIGLLVLAMLYLVVSGMARDLMRERALLPATGKARGVLRTGWIAAAVAVFVVALSAAATVRAQVVSVADTTNYGEELNESIAQRADQLEAEGHHLYGNGWWQAPVVALYGDLALTDLSKTDPCDPRFDPGASVSNYLIWDNYAVRIAAPAGWKDGAPFPPGGRAWKFTQIAGITDPQNLYRYTGIWEVQRSTAVKCAG